MKRIKLNKETVRKLDDKDMQSVKGGAGHKPCLIGVTVVMETRTCTKSDCNGRTIAGC